MDGWMHEWIYGWMYGQMGGWIGQVGGAYGLYFYYNSTDHFQWRYWQS